MEYTVDNFISKRKELKEKKLKLVFTNGCFDIIHRGHVEYLTQAKSLGDYLVVAVNSDDSVRRIKGEKRPLNNEQDRAFVLQSLKPVDTIIIFSEDTPYNLIKEIKPDILVKGGDWKENEIVGSDVVKSYDGKVFSLKYVDNYSTTAILKKINDKGL